MFIAISIEENIEQKPSIALLSDNPFINTNQMNYQFNLNITVLVTAVMVMIKTLSAWLVN